MVSCKLSPLSKLIGAFCMMSIWALSVNAQFLRTSYFMEGTHYRMQLNPALTPTRGYFNIPVIGSINATVGSTSLDYQDIIDIIDDSDNFYTNPKFLNRLKDKNHINVNVATEILSAGWYKGKNFWSVNVGLRTDIGATLTKSMFDFLNEMDVIEDNWLNSAYDISGQKMNVNAYTEVGLGYARAINSRLTVGGRVKALLGIGNMNLRMNEVRMSANLPSDARINEFRNMTLDDVNTEAKVNALRNEFNNYHALLAVDARLESSFKGLNLEEEVNEPRYISDIDFENKDLGIAGYGFGIDLGASYKIMDNLTVSASILDLGFISWSKGSTQIANANASGIDLKGSTYTAGIPTDPAVIEADPQATLDIIEANLNRLESDAQGYMDRVSGGDVLDYELLQLRKEEATKSRKSSLASTVVLGAEYGLLDNKLGLGLLSTTRFMKPQTLSEITFSANYRPKNWFNVALSYSVIQSAGKSFGLGLKLGPVFLGTDYMFLGKDSKTVNGFVGISVPLGKRKTT